MLHHYVQVALLLTGIIGQSKLACYGQVNQRMPWPTSVSEKLEIETYQHEQAGEKNLTRVIYGQSIAERTKSGTLTILAQGGGSLTKYLYQPYDEVIDQGESLKKAGQSKKAEELYAKTLKSLDSRQGGTSSARRLQQQLYILEATDGQKNAEQRLIDLTLQVLNEWGPYSELYTSILYEQIRYYDKTRKISLLSDALNKMSGVLRQRQRSLTAFLLNDFEYDTFLALHQRYIDQLLSTCVKYHNEQPDLVNLIADYTLVSRNLQLNGQRIIREHFIVKLVGDMAIAFGMSVGIPYLKETVRKTSPSSKEHQEAVADIERRQALIQQFNAKARRNLLYNDWAKAKQKVGDDRSEFNNLESQLNDSLSRFVDQLIVPATSTIIARLQPDQAIVDFFSYQDAQNQSKTLYGAVIYTKQHAKPGLVLLSSQEEVSQQIDKQRRKPSMRTTQLMDSINNLYTSSTLYGLIWKPLTAQLNGIHTIEYLPVDLLNAVAIDALVSHPNGKPLCEQFVLKRILTIPTAFAPSEVIAPEQMSEKQVNANFWGGIQYDKKVAKMPRKAQPSGEDIPLRGSVTTLTRGRNWDPLSGTDEEISKIENILKVFKKRNLVTYTKTKASEYAFKHQYTNLTHPHILHIATHGFYDNMTLTDPNGELNKLSSQSNEMMLKAGLVFAGANIPPEAGQEDGILTALEISRLNLNAKLVVLSACQSGLGIQKNNEGVFGLQRAFKLAGAEYLLMTLWEIPDKDTVEMMKYFYNNLANGQTIEIAFRNAQISMKSTAAPFSWASFVLLR